MLEPHVPGADRARFLSIASHDLRGALANVRSFAALLLRRGGLDERSRRMVETIVRNADRAIELTRGVFDTLRHELGQMPAEQTPVEPNELVRQAVGAVPPGTNIELKLEPVPRVWADAERLSHAIRLLAHVAGERSGPSGVVALRTVAEPGEVAVEISDEGAPPAPDELAFRRDAAVARENRLGTAFWLCLAKDELEASGARVEALSPGRGLTIRAHLPVYDAGGH